MRRFYGRTAMAMVVLCLGAAQPVVAAPAENEIELAQSTPPSANSAPAPNILGDRTIENLYNTCQKDSTATSWCSAYLMGAADTHSAFSTHKAGICGATYKIEDLGPIFMEWVSKHQELKDIDMLAGVNLAFRELWPCS